MNEVTTEMEQAFRTFIEKRNKIALLNNILFLQPEDIKKNLPWARLKLNGTQMNVLEMLSDGVSIPNGASAITIGEISKMEGLLKQAVTKPVAELVRVGLVRKFKKEGNKRSVYLELTEYGRQICHEQHEILHTYLRQRIFSVISLSELTEMTNILVIFENFLKRFSGDHSIPMRAKISEELTLRRNPVDTPAT